MRGCVSYHVTESSLGKGLIPPAVRYAAAEDVKYVKLCWKLPKKIGAPGNVGQGWTGIILEVLGPFSIFTYVCQSPIVCVYSLRVPVCNAIHPLRVLVANCYIGGIWAVVAVLM